MAFVMDTGDGTPE